MHLADTDKNVNQVLGQIIPYKEGARDAKMSATEHYDQALTSMRLLDSLIEFKEEEKMYEEGFSLQGTVYDFLWDKTDKDSIEQTAFQKAQANSFFYALSVPYILENFYASSVSKKFSDVTKEEFLAAFDKVDAHHKISAEKYELFETSQQVDMIHQIIGLFDRTMGKPDQKEVEEL